MSATNTPATTNAAAMLAEIARLKAENEALKNAPANKSKISLKISEKGAISVYGLGRFPVTLYRSQFLSLLDIGESIKAFMATNKVKLDEVEAAAKASKETAKAVGRVAV